MADDPHLRAPDLIIISRERPTEHSWHTEHREKVACDRLDPNGLRLRSVDLHPLLGNLEGGEDTGKTAATVAKLFVRSVGEVVVSAGAIDIGQQHKFVR